MLTIPIKYFDTEDFQMPRLKKIEQGNWIDLYCAQDTFVPFHKLDAVTPVTGPIKGTLIPLGIAMQLPQGYEAIMAPRSSTFKNYGVIQTNHIGVFDTKFCGDNDQWLFSAYCLMPHDIHNGQKGTWIRRGERIAQFRIQKSMEDIQWDEKAELGNEDRGGFGSTGVK